MSIALYSRPQSKYLPDQIDRLLELLEGLDPVFQVNEDFASQIEQLTSRAIAPARRYTKADELLESTSMIISYGGDGTLLEVVRLLGERSLPIFGVNSGRLGFLATVSEADIAPAFEALRGGEYTLQERTLLEVEGDFCAHDHFPYAFNELSVQRQDANMIEVRVSVDSEQVATIHGDGVLLSTPAGSTAYSLSVGGPVVAPQCHCFVIAPIAPHNLTMRPVVIPDSSEVLFEVYAREGGVSLTLDNRRYRLHSDSSFRVRKAEKRVNLVHLQNNSFYQTLRDKMMWGVDGRNQG